MSYYSSDKILQTETRCLYGRTRCLGTREAGAACASGVGYSDLGGAAGRSWA